MVILKYLIRHDAVSDIVIQKDREELMVRFQTIKILPHEINIVLLSYVLRMTLREALITKESFA
jgi:hypothetical protein